MNRKVTALVMAATATIPAAAGLTSLLPGQALAASKPAAKPKTQTFKGPVVDMRWGPVQAAIKVKSKKITDVQIATSPENQRSQFIDDQAVPMLHDETIQAQNANIDMISGATMTSEAYQESLQGAIDKAKHAKALK